MPASYSSRHIVRVLEVHGFIVVSQKGSHLKMRNQHLETVRTVIVPVNKKSIPHGTFRSIVRQSGLTQEDFAKQK